MAVIISDMKFPQRCLDCQLMGREKMYCQLYPRKDLNVIRVVSEKPNWCLLKEVPSGENIMIINKDKLHCDCSWDYEDDYYTAYSMYAIEAAQVEEQTGENT